MVMVKFLSISSALTLRLKNFETNKYYHPRKCYNCKGWAAKDRRCNHITCACGAQWCWFCGKEYDDDHWDNGECKDLHTEGDCNNNFDKYRDLLNSKMKLNDDDLLPWERKKNLVTKKAIEAFINRASGKGKEKLAGSKTEEYFELEGSDDNCCLKCCNFFRTYFGDC